MNLGITRGGAENSTAVRVRIVTSPCPSTPVDPGRPDGDPQPPTDGTQSVPDIAAVTDYSPTIGSPTIGVDDRLITAGLVDVAGKVILEKNSNPWMADGTDSLSNTISDAESAGRPFVARKSEQLGSDLARHRVDGGAGAGRPATRTARARRIPSVPVEPIS